jgi:hypothetical protein
MLNRVMRFKIEKQKLEAEVKSVCQDKSISLAERWELFTCSGFGENETYVQDFDTLLEIFDANRFSWYDIFYKDRYAEVHMQDIVENLEEGAYGYKVSRVQINKLKEEILEKFLRSFTNDW